MKPTNISSNRRSFLLGATLGTAGAVAGAAALITGKSVEEILPPAAPEADTATGYRMTPHIQQYYDTTKL
jgi:hypothetical protein